MREPPAINNIDPTVEWGRQSDVCPLPFCQSVNCYNNNARGIGMKCALCVRTGSSSDSIHRVYTTVAYSSLNFGCEETRQNRGGEHCVSCPLSFLLIFFFCARTVLEDGCVWARMGKKKTDLFWGTERNSSARIAISLHGPLNGRAGKERVRLCRQAVSPPVVVSLL